MADLPEPIQWTPGIYQLETSDPVLGGPEGIDNLQAKQLASRTQWLKDQLQKVIDGVTAIVVATKLAVARTISISGAGSGSASFDGSANVSISLTLADSGVAAGAWTKVTVNAKGLVTAGGFLAAADIPALDWSKISTGKPTTLGGYGITDALAIGQYGLGAAATPNAAIDTIGLPGGFYTMGGGNTGLLQNSSVLNLPYSSAGYSAQIAIEQGGSDVLIVARAVNAQGNWTPVRTLWHSGTFNPATKADAAATETALAAKAPLASPSFTGTPTVPTAAASTNTTQASSTAFVKTAVAAVVGSAPAALDTLGKQAAAIGNDPNFATTMASQLSGKAAKATTLAGYGITDAVKIGTYGLAGTTAPIQAIETLGLPGGFYAMDGTTTTLLNYSSILNLPYSSPGFTAQLAIQQGAAQVKIVARATNNSGGWTATAELYTTANTTRAADGTLKAI
ncbi:hypothetical protein [Pseudomonas chlororaphis]|uniref:Phage tail fiber protein n=1 Tax=Pseudomonas chlororaphis TaxID=587753 RepID=A0A0D5Y414_9PSED|nr:hypothetical protein [Pseudomonas chlororaphis]AKA25719.1 hypothetical protein PCL1606_42720 [Pseudomonas chlororaphis]